MKRPFALMLALVLSIGLNVSAQNGDQKLVGDTLVTGSGYKVFVGQKLKLGRGTSPNGDFIYIRINGGSMFNYSSTVPNYANTANNLNRSHAGREFKVVKIVKRGTKKTGIVYYPVINIGMVRYECDIENAIAMGEVEVPEEYLPRKKESVVVVKEELSVADELSKLKKLLDDGVITKEEFDSQKKKLLEKN